MLAGAKGNVVGLSPRVRGNRAHDLPGHSRGGSIPACAGEPPSEPSRTSTERVYPRVCGGTLRAFGVPSEEQGLSPRVRGNRERSAPAREYTGSIPACAGEPMNLRSTSFWARVYPRVCGGTEEDREPRTEQWGLSPRVRGNLRWPSRRGHRPGSIPACAGEPSSISSSERGSGVYPRVCGGTRRESTLGRLHPGLSPRVRGNLMVVTPW